MKFELAFRISVVVCIFLSIGTLFLAVFLSEPLWLLGSVILIALQFSVWYLLDLIFDLDW